MSGPRFACPDLWYRDYRTDTIDRMISRDRWRIGQLLWRRIGRLPRITICSNEATEYIKTANISRLPQQSRQLHNDDRWTLQEQFACERRDKRGRVVPLIGTRPSVVAVIASTEHELLHNVPATSQGNIIRGGLLGEVFCLLRHSASTATLDRLDSRSSCHLQVAPDAQKPKKDSRKSRFPSGTPFARKME